MKHSVPILLLVISLASWVSAQDEGETIDPAASRELIRQWVQTERLLSEEATAWQVEKKRMQDLLDLYRKELQLLDEEISKAGASVGMVDENKERLEAELRQFREAQRLLRGTMARLLPRMKALVSSFPGPLRDEITADSGMLAQPAALEKPRDVLKSMIAILTSAERFNRSITIAEETREFSGGKKMTVDVLYLGLSRAYYATGAGDTAGIGIPSAAGEDGWVWKEEPAIADDVRRAIAVYEKDKQPQLIKLPVQVLGGKKGGEKR